MKVAITGCTGYVGQQLVPLLEKKLINLLLLGRSKDHVENIFPGRNCDCYSNIPKLFTDVDLVIHLAVMNNNSFATEKDFDIVNFDFTVDLLQKCTAAGVKKFISISSFHELDRNIQTPYAKSKRKVSKMLDEIDSITVTKIYAPYIFGEKFSGKLAILNRLPKFVANILFYALQSLRPSMHIGRIVDVVLESPKMAGRGNKYLYENADQNGFYRFFKRLIDVVFSMAVIILLFWLLAVVWIAVQVESGRPGIFSQDRVGRNGKLFRCHKFRTMKQSTVQLGTHEVPASAVTKLGRMLRSTKLDELPQVWNILRNELSLVGPRPCLPVQIELVAARKALGVLTVKPGITGLAQINDIDMSDPLRLAEWDERYAARRSLLLDINIILATLVGSGSGDRVKES